MLLEPGDVQQFFRLHRTLMFFVNQRLKVIPDPLPTPEAFAALLPGARLAVRDAWLANPDLTESFVTTNPAQLPETELGIVRSWRHLVAGKFYVFRALKKHTVFLSTTDPNHSPPVAQNVLDRDVDPEEPNTSWVADVTYIPTREGWLYLAAVEDLFSRRVVGWSMDATTTSRLVVDAPEMALVGRLRGPSSSALVAHSDRGASTRASTTGVGCARRGSRAA